MSKIETALEQIEVKEVDKNRSTEDLLMDVIGCLVDANRNRDNRADVRNIIPHEFKDELGSNKRVRIFCGSFSEKYHIYGENTLEDSLACAVIKLLEIAKIKEYKIKDIESALDYYSSIIDDTYSVNILIDLYYVIQELIKDSDSWISDNIASSLASIKVIAEKLEIDLWRHVELRLKYQNI